MRIKLSVTDPKAAKQKDVQAWLRKTEAILNRETEKRLKMLEIFGSTLRVGKH